MTPATPLADPVSAGAPLAGRTALVTGGAGGLGQAICTTLAAAGTRVAIADIRADAAHAAAERLDGTGSRAIALALDLSDAGSCARAVDEVAERLGPLDILVNNAGVDVTLPADELAIADWDRIVAVNLRAAFVLARAAIPAMKRAGRGDIVNIVSTAARRAWPNASAYHASKWGLLGLSHALHAELRPRGIKVTALISGGMRTPFLLDRFPGIDQSTLQEPSAVAEAVRFVLTQPAGTVIPELMVLPTGETSWP